MPDRIHTERPEADRHLVRRIEADARNDGWGQAAAIAFAVLASDPHPNNEQRAREILQREREDA